MQSNDNSQNISRKSYGFSMPEQHQLRTFNNNGFPQQSGVQQGPNRPQNMQAPGKKMDKPEPVESPTRKKVTPSDISTVSPNLPPDNKFRPQFVMLQEVKTEQTQQLSDTFLRGSCSNVLRKFQQSNNLNLNASLRNTTQFNPINKLGNNVPEIKKPPNEANPFKNSVASKAPTAQTTSFLKPVEKLKNNASQIEAATSRTPMKLFAERKKMEQSANFSTTPTKYKPYENTSKSTAMRKTLNGEQEKKPFKSLNQIVESKVREKIALEAGKGGLPRSKIVNGFEMGITLGKGKFGEVFRSRHHDVGFVVALKKVMKSKVAQFKMVDQFCKQIRLHSCLDHPNIVKFYGCFEDKEDIYLVLEYMNGGTLFDYLNQVNHLNVREAVDYLRDIIEALIYMHEKSIAHRDIKPQNIVISTEGVAKLCDFGWSAVVQTSRKTYCGTFDYAPPEILQRKNYDASVDIWCIGVLTYELLTGRVPFQGEQKNIIMQKIVNTKTRSTTRWTFLPRRRSSLRLWCRRTRTCVRRRRTCLNSSCLICFLGATTRRRNEFDQFLTLVIYQQRVVSLICLWGRMEEVLSAVFSGGRLLWNNEQNGRMGCGEYTCGYREGNRQG